MFTEYTVIYIYAVYTINTIEDLHYFSYGVK